MPKRRLTTCALLTLCMLLSACGQVDPSVSAPGTGEYQVTGAPAQAVATTGGPSWALSASPTENPNAPVRLAMNDAIAYAKTTLHATHPSVAEAGEALFDPTDPKSEVWVVRLVGDTFQLPPCSPGTPQTTYARTCGTGTQARLGLRMSDYTVEYAEVYSAGTPTAQTPITLPPNAKLPTREAAIDAVLHPGGDTGDNPAHVVSADLILAGQEPRLNNVAPDTPIWRIVLDHGHFDYSCPPEAAAKHVCYSTAITIWIDAVTGLWHAATFGPPGTPTP